MRSAIYYTNVKLIESKIKGNKNLKSIVNQFSIDNGELDFRDLNSILVAKLSLKIMSLNFKKTEKFDFSFVEAMINLDRSKGKVPLLD